MTNATIELRTKSAFRILELPDVGVAQHTFIVYTNSLPLGVGLQTISLSMLFLEI